MIAFGEESQLVAEAGECAAEQNQFWLFYNNVMRLQFSGDAEDVTLEMLQVNSPTDWAGYGAF